MYFSFQNLLRDLQTDWRDKGRGALSVTHVDWDRSSLEANLVDPSYCRVIGFVVRREGRLVEKTLFLIPATYLKEGERYLMMPPGRDLVVAALLLLPSPTRFERAEVV